MDVVGSEIGHKMRSAIKAKLTELGCYVDDELPDYVMVMVANKRTRSQMEEDLQLFLGDNTELFVNWLHQVLKKLQEVTVSTPLKSIESEKIKERSKSKEKKLKDKKEKLKKSDGSKKSKKKAKEKSHKNKEEKKKNKKKKHEMIRPNIPPLLMNIEKESEPSITDVFAGQILKNHGGILDTHKDEPKIVEKKPTITETKRPMIPIIDPASILSQTASSDIEELITTQTNNTDVTLTPNDTVVTSKSSDSISVPSKINQTAVNKIGKNAVTPERSKIIDKPKASDNVIAVSDPESREEKIKEMNEIEAKIQGLKQKLADQLDNQNDSVSDDEDFLNIRTEADELINDFAEDVFQEISQPPPIATPPLRSRQSHSPTPPLPVNIRKVVPKEIPETLPQIELNLPKRPIRERLGVPIQKIDPANEKNKGVKATERVEKTPERLTPEKEPETRPQKSKAKSRLGNQPERTEHQRKRTTTDESSKSESGSKRLTSRVSVLKNRPSRVTCASVVRVRPRPRVSAPASSLLLRAVADAHKSLLNIPLKAEPEPQNVKRALVLPMCRSVDPKKIVIEVPCNEISTNNSTDSISDNVSLGDFDSGSEEKSPRASRDAGKEEYSPIGITKVIHNTEYIPSRTLIRKNDTLHVETINIHKTSIKKDKDTQFIVTMDGYHPNAFLAKKLMTEGLLNDDEEISKPNKSDKTEINKKGPLGSLKNDSKGTKDVGKMFDAKAKPFVISSQLQVRDKTTDHTEDDSKSPEVDISDIYISDLSVDNHRRETSITNSSVEKRKSDSPPHSPIVIKQERDSSVEKTNEKTKVDNSIENSTPEKRKIEVSVVKPMQEKRKISVDKPVLEKRKSDISIESSISENDKTNTPPVKRRKASPIIFDVDKKEKIVEKKERTTSSSSDGHVVLTTASNTHKYDTVPPLSQSSKQVWCRTFPQCRYGAACAFAHPRCKFAAACTRRGCAYSHAPTASAPPALTTSPVVASHVVPAANYKSISAGAFGNLCKFYPSCSNPACHFYHPKPCRYGQACSNKPECNFYHHDAPTGKWKYGV